MELFIVVSLAAFALIIIMGITITLCLRGNNAIISLLIIFNELILYQIS